MCEMIYPEIVVSNCDVLRRIVKFIRRDNRAREKRQRSRVRKQSERKDFLV